MSTKEKAGAASEQPVMALFAPGIDAPDFWHLQQGQARFRAPHVVSWRRLPSVFASILDQWRLAQ